MSARRRIQVGPLTRLPRGLAWKHPAWVRLPCRVLMVLGVLLSVPGAALTALVSPALEAIPDGEPFMALREEEDKGP